MPVVKTLKIIPAVFLSLLACKLMGFSIEEDEFKSLIFSDYLSEKVLIEMPGAGKLLSKRIFSQDLGRGNFSWNGRILNSQTGYLTFSTVDGKFSGSITRLGESSYRFSGSITGLDFEEVKEFSPCGGCVVESSLPPDPRYSAVPAKSWHNGEAHLIDILVVYPTAVRSEAGNTSDVEATIASAVADSNLCYRKSLVPIQLRVVHMAEVNYTPTGTLNIDLDRLKEKNDGYIDEVHDLRDQYGADLVCLLTTDSDFGGLASTMKRPTLGFESSGFNVNVWDQLGAPNYTLAHEIGHNMGCLHNREDATWSDDYDYGDFCFGKRWLVGSEGTEQLCRTTMQANTITGYLTSPTRVLVMRVWRQEMWGQKIMLKY